MMATVRYCEILPGRFNVYKICAAAVEAAATTTTTTVVVMIYNIRHLSF
jgi:hypothetical protein